MYVLKLLLLGLCLVATLARPSERDEDDVIADDDTPVPFSLEEAYSGRFSAYSFNGTWISSTEIMYRQSGTKNLLKFSASSLESVEFLNATVLTDVNGTGYSLSPDGLYLLIRYDDVTGFRHSTYSKYLVYDIADQRYDEIANLEHLPLASWAPTGNGLVYVLDNDVYYRSISGNSATVRRLTSDGETGVVYNGVPDWVYEEEILGTGSAVWFSPDGNHLAFATFDDTDVKEATYYYYGEPGDAEYQYPTDVKIKYPKAGSTNPLVYLTLVDLSNASSPLINLSAPIDIVGSDHILYTVSWLNDETVAVTWTNRVQNVGQIVAYDVSGNETYLLTLNETEGWLEVPTPIIHDDYLILLSYQESGTAAGRFNHVTRYQLSNGVLSNETDMSPGTVAVTSLLGTDKINERIYYLATGSDEPSQRNLYSVPIKGDNEPTCISCNYLTPEGNNCTYATVRFSSDMSFYTLTCAGPDPTTARIYNSSHQQVYSWQENESLRERLKAKLQPTPLNLIITANGYGSKVRLLLPPQFDENDSYPMMVYVYAGPNTVRITDAASYGFHSFMTTNRSVIYAWIDGRGSAYKGSAMLYEIYRALGTVEIEDQIAVTKILKNKYSWIDSNRIAIWGWSYGGYATAMVLATDTESVFKCGISVAPVSSWIYYDTMYTERYMGLPTKEDNLYGYNASDVTRLVDGIRGKKYMLIHGTGDDNVHYQQAMALAKALSAADILFEQVSYTDEAHGLTSVYPHLYHTMDKFWGDCLDLSYIY
ncbi:venom dipeptidyl peptidase 4 isoform X2 [Cephus cinctus]|uniref:Venom dipeptidyl peptidase 4 n=1 Tax=Cephus cinctus TaxID=211228 RepID=A0AAJ7C3H1_CEPCN|nr:venom dipeptidyl peptidase 4 isoform X2 [Cephus cinctus]